MEAEVSRDIDEPSSEEDVFREKRPRSSCTSNKSIPSSVSENRTKKIGFECQKCSKTFSHVSSLSKHKKHCGVGLVCGKCSVSYSNLSNFNAHKKICSSLPRYTPCIYPGCEQRFYKKIHMVDHLESYHFVHCGVKNLHFESMESFLEWKEAEDRKNFVSSVLHSGCKTVLDSSSTTDRVTYSCYCCNFDVQKRKGVSSRKVPNYNCPSRMLLRQDSNGCHCKYISTHNHILEASHLKYHRLSEEVRTTIKSKTLEGIPANIIEEHLRPKNDGRAFYPLKERLVNLKTINNYQYRLRVAARLHKDDATSTDMLVHQMMENDEILLYKPQNGKTVVGPVATDKLPDSDSLFILGFQNKRMREELLAGATRVLCVDATHKTNRFDFQLLSFIVPDEYDVGYPVAHFISNRMDGKTIEMMLQTLKEKSPNLKINIVMKDDDQALENAIAAVFPRVDQFLCTWHMEKALNKNLNSHIKDPLLHQSMKADIKNLIEEKNTNDFETMLENFIEMYLADTRSKSFIDYFVGTHKGRAKFWAKCYRNKPHSDTDTNMFCESFHNVLKGPLYLKRKVNARIDDLLETLRKFEYRKYINLITNRILKKPPIGFKGNDATHDRHIKGMKIPNDTVVKVSESESEWNVKASKSDLQYRVTNFHDVCPLSDHCFVKCEVRACSKLCMHLYNCNCPDEHPVCKHIHKVHNMRISLNPGLMGKSNEISDADSWQMHQRPCESAYPDFELPNIAVDVKNIQDLLEKIKDHLEQECVTNKLTGFIKGALERVDIMCQSEINRSRNSKGKIDSVVISNNAAEGNAIRVSEESAEENIIDRVDLPEEMPGTRNCLAESRTLTVGVEEKKESPNPTFPNPPKIAPNQKVEKQRLFYRTAKRKTLLNTKKRKPLTKKDLMASKSKLLCLKSSLTVDEIMDKVIYDLASITEVCFECHNVPIQVLFLKSLDDELPIEEADALSYLTKKEFVRGWLYEAILDAFFLIVLEDEPDRLSVPGTKSAILSSAHISSQDCLVALEEINLNGIEDIFFPCNPEGSHWILLVTNVSDKCIYFLDPNRPSCIIDMFRDVTSAEEPVLHLYSNNTSCPVVFINDSYNRLISRWRMILNTKLGLSNQQWNVSIPEHALQENWVDCGVFVSWFCDRIVSGGDLLSPPNTHEYRMHILKKIVSAMVPINSKKSDAIETDTVETAPEQILLSPRADSECNVNSSPPNLVEEELIGLNCDFLLLNSSH